MNEREQGFQAGYIQALRLTRAMIPTQDFERAVGAYMADFALLPTDARAAAVEQPASEVDRFAEAIYLAYCEGANATGVRYELVEKRHKESVWRVKARAALAATPPASPNAAVSETKSGEREVPDGWKLVPVSPTKAMLEAGDPPGESWWDDECPLFVWERMLAASPTPSAAPLDRRDGEMREAAINAALCLSGFAGEGLQVVGFADPADVYCALTKALGMPNADDDDLRLALSASSEPRR